jgi:hypothetical protein
MNPSDWIYHLNLRTTLERNGFLDPCAMPRQRRDRVRRAPSARRMVFAGAAALAPVAWLVAAIVHG